MTLLQTRGRCPNPILSPGNNAAITDPQRNRFRGRRTHLEVLLFLVVLPSCADRRTTNASTPCEEETIVHELVHVVLWPLDIAAMDLTEAVGPAASPARDFARSTVFRALEPVTEQLTRALLSASGRQSQPAWRALEAEAAQRLTR